MSFVNTSNSPDLLPERSLPFSSAKARGTGVLGSDVLG